MKPLIKILAKCYAILITPFVLRLLYGLWIFERSYADWSMGAIAFLTVFFGFIMVMIFITGIWRD